MIKEENYEEIFKNDVIGATVLFDEMKIREQFFAIIYLLDHADVCSENIKELLTTPRYKIMLLAISKANKEYGGDVERLVPQALKNYYVDNGIEPKIEEEEINDKPEIEVKNKPYLLIGS